MTQPYHIRIFLSSPGDVADERTIALRIIDQLPYDPLLRGKVTFDVIAWDKPGASTPMLATMTPQEAINRGLGKPSDCDIVVVLFWTRMGTPLPPEYTKDDGSRFLSGTEWEYLDAFEKARDTGLPLLVVYRRTEQVLVSTDDPDFIEKQKQHQRVKDFFAAFINPDGSIKQGYNLYETPEHFRKLFEVHVRDLVKQILDIPVSQRQLATTEIEPPALWTESPFPGLRAFTQKDGPIFFGRGRETDALITEVASNRFVVVVGSSGSGKSSLVGAGLLPRLTANAIANETTGSRFWQVVRFTPGEVGSNPLMALAVALKPLANNTPRELAEDLTRDPAALDTLLAPYFEDAAEWSEVLFFVDQFEELFTLAHPAQIEPFVRVMTHISQSDRLRAVVTLRADFYPHWVKWPGLTRLLEGSQLPLSTPSVIALHDMIVRPAERAGLAFEEGLPEQIINDTGNEPGSLALMAYTLDELYQARGDDGQLTFAKYDAMGGVQGSIAQRAEDTFHVLPDEAQDALLTVFRRLVEIDENGLLTRHRARLSQFTGHPGATPLIDALTTARLLTRGTDDSQNVIIEVAHEALLTNWPRLRDRLDEERSFLQWRQRLYRDAEEWSVNARDSSYLYGGLRLSEAVRWIGIPEYARELTERALAFVAASRRRHRRFQLLRAVLIAIPVIISIIALSNWTRLELLRRGAMGETALYDTSTASLGSDNADITVEAFEIDKYEVSLRQYRLCVQAEVCSPPFVTTITGNPFIEEENDQLPVTMINAYQASEFCEWIGRRLPTSAEWERAARGTDGRLWPWSGQDAPDGTRVNMVVDTPTPTTRPTNMVTVDDPAFSSGATPEEVLHLLGNVMEWTATESNCTDTCETVSVNYIDLSNCQNTCTASQWNGTMPTTLLIRGWSWNSGQITLPPGPATEWHTPLVEVVIAEATTVREDLGFRCARSR